jgi:NADH-quinone oxidoreductase subunit N
MPVLHPDFWRLLSPEWVLVIFGTIFMLLSAVPGGKNLRLGIGVLSVAGLAVALVLTFQTLSALGPGMKVPALMGLNGDVGLVIDAFSQSFKVIILLGALVTLFMSFKSLEVEKAWTGEYFTFITFAVFGMMVMASGNDLLTLWVGLETMALSVYVLAAYLRRSEHSVEGATKYFLLGAFSSGFYLYGASLIYGATGSVHLDVIRQVLAARLSQGGMGAIGFPLGAGVVILAVALLFKAALVPFHWWTPDAYEGAITPITGFMSVAPKAAAFAMAMRIFVAGLMPVSAKWVALLSLVAIVTMFWGNIAAMLQQNVKRMLAYSSIAHAGYALVGLIATGKTGTDQGVQAVIFYLLAYAFMNLGAFGLVLYLQREGSAGDSFEDFNDLIRRRPAMAVLMILFLLSLGGIPPLAGFMGKFLIFSAAVTAKLYVLAVVLAVTSVISMYYYFRLILHMFLKDNEKPAQVQAGRPLAFALSFCGAGVLVIGIYAQPFLNWVGRAVLVAH